MALLISGTPPAVPSTIVTTRIGLFCLFLCVFPASEAQAQSDIVSSPRVDCYQSARESSDLTRQEALTLCSGANSAAPALCYQQARQSTLLDRYDVIQLCRCSRSLEAVQCYKEAERDITLDKADRIALCQAPVAGGYAYLYNLNQCA